MSSGSGFGWRNTCDCGRTCTFWNYYTLKSCPGILQVWFARKMSQIKVCLDDRYFKTIQGFETTFKFWDSFNNFSSLKKKIIMVLLIGLPQSSQAFWEILSKWKLGTSQVIWTCDFIFHGSFLCEDASNTRNGNSSHLQKLIFSIFVINTRPRVVFLRLCAVFVKNETLKKYLQTFASFYFHILPCKKKKKRTHTDYCYFRKMLLFMTKLDAQRLNFYLSAIN